MGLFGKKDDEEKAAARKEAEVREKFLEARRKAAAAGGAPPEPIRGTVTGPAATAPVPPAASAPAATTAATTYTVKSGDSLSKIAKAQLGDGNRWRELYEANRDVIGDNPDLIKPGQVLRIPR